jgi:hypothetical protein
MARETRADRQLDELLSVAGRLVRAAHRDDQLGVRAALHDADDLVGDPLTAARLLLVLLAAMCPDDASPEQLIGWRRNPTEYHRLRSLGVPSREAAELAVRVADFLQRSA